VNSEHARAGTPAEAAQAGDLVVATIPLNVYTALPAAALRGKTVIDTMHYYNDRDARIPQLDCGDLTSSAMVQQHLAGSRVVKACNNIVFHHLLTLARPPHSPQRSALPIASDSHDAKKQVAQFLNVVGYDTVDIGSLSDSWRSQPIPPSTASPTCPSTQRHENGRYGRMDLPITSHPRACQQNQRIHQIRCSSAHCGSFEFVAAG